MNERLLPLFKEEGLKKLNNATVAVVGVGGVGGICAITLARSGIGTIIIQDFDKVEEIIPETAYKYKSKAYRGQTVTITIDPSAFAPITVRGSRFVSQL